TATALAVDRNGNVFVTGSSYNGLYYDYATVGYSTTGTPLWTNLYNGPANNDDNATAITVDSGGNVIVTRYSTGKPNNYDYATIKYSGAGTPLWTNRYNGPGDYTDQASALAVDGSGNVFVTGSSYGVGYATIKYSGAGTPLWTNTYTLGGMFDYAAALVV